MYNRYIPDGASYSRIPEEDAPSRPSPQPPPNSGRARRPPQKENPSGPLDGALSWLGGLLKNIHLDGIDSGDILLVLILLFLFLESDDNLELVITLGLLLLFGVFSKEEPKDDKPKEPEAPEAQGESSPME